MRLRPVLRGAAEVFRRVNDDGFIHAGNLAYLSLTSLFPLFLVIAAIAGALGRTDTGSEVLQLFFDQVPDDVAESLEGPISGLVRNGAGGGLLTVGLLVGLWSVSGYVNTIRDIIRRAHGSPPGSMWRERLLSVAGVLGAVVLLLIGFTAQVLIEGARQFIEQLAPVFSNVLSVLSVSRIGPGVIIFLSLAALFRLLTPRSKLPCGPAWPGALLTTIVWLGATTVLPLILASVANYQRTYGSLAGVMISLLFFYVVGLGLVTGAHLNAVLAGATPLKDKVSAERG
jgi:membrane protein